MEDLLNKYIAYSEIIDDRFNDIIYDMAIKSIKESILIKKDNKSFIPLDDVLRLIQKITGKEINEKNLND
jgi:hypothetical protein